MALNKTGVGYKKRVKISSLVIGHRIYLTVNQEIEENISGKILKTTGNNISILLSMWSPLSLYRLWSWYPRRVFRLRADTNRLYRLCVFGHIPYQWLGRSTYSPIQGRHTPDYTYLWTLFLLKLLSMTQWKFGLEGTIYLVFDILLLNLQGSNKERCHQEAWQPSV